MTNQIKICNFFIFVIALFLFGCDVNNQPARPKTPKEVFLSSASAIASDPSNWVDNSKYLVEFTKASVDLRLNNEADVKEFSESIVELIAFSTKWISNVNQVNSSGLKNGVTDIIGKVNTKIAQLSGTAGEIYIKEIEESAQKLFSRSITNLSVEQAKEFGKVFGRVVKAYEKICILARGK